jgi:hypothetical protein
LEKKINVRRRIKMDIKKMTISKMRMTMKIKAENQNNSLNLQKNKGLSRSGCRNRQKSHQKIDLLLILK